MATDQDRCEDADGGIMRQEIADLNRHAREDEIRAEYEEAYELDDPKHPTFHDRYADLADLND